MEIINTSMLDDLTCANYTNEEVSAMNSCIGMPFTPCSGVHNGCWAFGPVGTCGGGGGGGGCCGGAVGCPSLPTFET